MAQCLNCGRNGFFLSVDEYGLCKTCDLIVLMEVTQRARLIQESMDIINKSKKLDTQLSRCDFVIECAQALLPFERKGIPTINPKPSELIEQFPAKRNEILITTLKAEVETALAKSRLATSTKTKLSVLAKVLLRIREYIKQCTTPDELSFLEAKILNVMHQIQLNAYLEAAEKAELKGQKKKALDQYYEALYFLKHDEVDDSMQRDQISAIEAKIAEIGGKVIDQSDESAIIPPVDEDLQDAE
jgi:hypothetical protein